MDHAPSPHDGIITSAAIAYAGTSIKIEVYEYALNMRVRARENTGDGDTRNTYLTRGNAWADTWLGIRGWVVGGTVIGLANIGEGSELDVTLNMQAGHTVPGKLTLISLATKQSSRTQDTPIALGGHFAGVTEAYA